MLRIFNIYIFMIAFLLMACNNNVMQEKEEKTFPTGIVTAQGVRIPVYNYESLNPLLNRANDTLYIFNFWATWCIPCIRELPHFERVNVEYADHKLKVVLISLDYPEDIEGALIPFMIEKKIRSKVVNLDDPDANRWIPSVDPSWDGAIPATLFKYGSKRKFMAHTFTYDELVNEIENLLNQ